ncbi:hypothetical protein V1498_08675 [Peribacillus sp. SCS-26]|uniref:hypothetical protein n=1 Tax=Paraperibacillus marinus TaxID=3115295 RepID=UPI003905E833
MNIQHYYREAARAELCASWASLILGILFSCLHAAGFIYLHILIAVGPFIALSCFFFIKYTIQAGRGRDSISETASRNPLSESYLLFSFLPAPTLRLLLFSSDGSAAGELRDCNMKSGLWLVPGFMTDLLKKNYCLIDSEGRNLYAYTVKGFFSQTMEIRNRNGEITGLYKEEQKQSMLKIRGTVFDPLDVPMMAVSFGAGQGGFKAKDGKGAGIGSMQKGYLPVPWQERFKKINTPVIHFSELADDDERAAVIGICALICNGRNN